MRKRISSLEERRAELREETKKKIASFEAQVLALREENLVLRQRNSDQQEDQRRLHRDNQNLERALQDTTESMRGFRSYAFEILRMTDHHAKGDGRKPRSGSGART